MIMRADADVYVLCGDITSTTLPKYQAASIEFVQPDSVNQY